jgi:hypothetical protein
MRIHTSGGIRNTMQPWKRRHIHSLTGNSTAIVSFSQGCLTRSQLLSDGDRRDVLPNMANVHTC